MPIENTVDIDDLSEELRYTQRRLRELQKAIPPLPKPQLLYEKIVSQCFDTYACTEAVSVAYLVCTPSIAHCLENNVRRVLETLMRQPQEVRQGEPLLMDMETIEIVISDHLQTLTSLHDTLENLRLNVQDTKDQETLAFENHVRSTLSKLEQLTLEVKTNVVGSSRSKESKPDPEDDNVGEREGIQRIQEENDIIERNANFMEGIEEPEEAAQEGDEEPVDAEDRVDDDPNDLPEEDDEEIIVSRIQQELRNTEQAILDFDRMLRQLEEERLCPPRRYDQGYINKAHERFMRCAFCEAVGYHYSDSCTVVRDVASRRQLIESNNRCEQCLEVICARGLTCKKSLTICFYCRSRGHHSALCELPDYSESIRSRKANAHEARRRSFAKLCRLREELALLRNHS
ncbi:hypothetical protein COOONC_01881 [Cooperia oncophora]